MNYTEALKITKGASSSNPLNIALGLSGSSHALITYLTAAAELNRRKLECEVPDITIFLSRNMMIRVWLRYCFLGI